MPCRDYEDDNRGYVQVLRERNDELARYACVFATLLEEYAVKRRIPLEELHAMIKAKSPEYGGKAVKWWVGHKAADEADKRRQQEDAVSRKKAAAVVQSLSKEQRAGLQAIGVKLPTFKSKKKEK